MTAIALSPSLDIASLSVQGTGRENNEDAYFVSALNDFFVVADGMGGLEGGELASSETVSVIAQTLRTSSLTSVLDLRQRLTAAVEKANAKVLKIAREKKLSGIGSTCVIGVRFGDQFHFLGIGDSRVYHVGHRLRQLTADDTFAELLVSIGQLTRDQVGTSPRRNMLLSYIGSHDLERRSETIVVRPAVGDRFLLCSDGITDKLEDQIIERILMKADSANDAASALVTAAQEAGSKDDMTCIVISID